MATYYELTNYISRETGRLYHGSELTYKERKSGKYVKITSYQAHQNMPYSIDKGTHFEVVRKYYNKTKLVAKIEKINTGAN